MERSFDWLVRHRRLARDYERTTESSEAIRRLASIPMIIPALKPSRMCFLHSFSEL
ncbi:hypothetical protein [Tautonia marina]